jgi:DNA-binding NtrC family response regulator
MIFARQEMQSQLESVFGVFRWRGAEMRNDEQVLVICAERETRERVIATTRKCGLGAVNCSTLDDAQSLLARRAFRVVFCGDVLQDGSFREVIRAAKSIPVIVLSRLAEWESYFAATQAGAFDHIACPPDPSETERILRCALSESSGIHAGVVMAA